MEERTRWFKDRKTQEEKRSDLVAVRRGDGEKEEERNAFAGIKREILNERE